MAFDSFVRAILIASAQNLSPLQSLDHAKYRGAGLPFCDPFSHDRTCLIF